MLKSVKQTFLEKKKKKIIEDSKRVTEPVAIPTKLFNLIVMMKLNVKSTQMIYAVL